MNPETGNDYGFTPPGKPIVPIVGFLQGTASYASKAEMDASDDAFSASFSTRVSNLESAGTPYTTYVAFLYQQGPQAPSASILENTLGEVLTWAYDTDGYAYINSVAPLFKPGKYTVTMGASLAQGFYSVYRNNDNQLSFEQYDFNGNPSDNICNSGSIEIKIYP